MNPAPDADLVSVGPANFEWIVDAVAKLAVKKAQAELKPIELRWSSFLGAESLRKPAPKKAPAKKVTAKKTTQA